MAAGQNRAARPPGIGRAGRIWLLRLFPRIRLCRVKRRRPIHDVMHPAVPARGNFRRFRDARINHPPPLDTECRIDFAAPVAIVAVAELVDADEPAVYRSPYLRSEGLAIPPGKDAQQKGFHERTRWRIRR